jgi:UDP-N-acetylglucosamine 1-carboxyvinyltransferase
MKILEILGGKPLKGEIYIAGAKNASMPIIIASILSSEPCLIHNVPHVSDITNLLRILTSIGTKITIDGNHTENPSKTILIQSQNLSSEVTDYNITKLIRTSVLLLGPLLAKNGYVKLARPGGCNIGDRKIDLHIMAMEKLGAVVMETDNYIEAKAPNGLVGAEIEFPFISVGATENAITASVMAKGVTILKNVAIEPEIEDLINFLNKLGAKISKTSERELTIHGVAKLGATEHSIIQDRIEAATYAIAAAITDGSIILHNCPMSVFEYIHEILESVGVNIQNYNTKGIIATRSKNGLKPIEVETKPYPLFPTDLQPQLMTLLSLTNGQSVITESIFENRLQHVAELRKLGANITVNGNVATIDGAGTLHSGVVESTDLRACAALVLAGLACKEKIMVESAQYIDRGYQTFVKNLTRCGAHIKLKYS